MATIDESLGSKIIRFNVGGRKFATTCATLFSKGENFLTALVRNDLDSKMLSIKDEDGHLFVDRNGDAFALILDYFRTGHLWMESPNVSRQQLLQELDFYQIALPLSLQTLLTDPIEPLLDKQLHSFNLEDKWKVRRREPTLGHTAAIDRAVVYWKCRARMWLEANLEKLNDIIGQQSKVGNCWAYITFTSTDNRAKTWCSGNLEIPSEELHAPLWRQCLCDAVELFSDQKVHLEFNSATSVTLKWSDLLHKRIDPSVASEAIESALHRPTGTPPPPSSSSSSSSSS